MTFNKPNRVLHKLNKHQTQYSKNPKFNTNITDFTTHKRFYFLPKLQEFTITHY